MISISPSQLNTMSTFATDQATNDFIVNSSGQLVLVYDVFSISTVIRSVLQTELGELPYATTIGVPNVATAVQGQPNLGLYQAALSKAIMGVDGVTEIISLTLNIVENKLTYNVVFNSVYGTGAVTNA